MNQRTPFEVLFALVLPLVFSTDRAAAATATLYVNVVDDIADGTPGDGLCRTAPGGPCTLRAAIQEASSALYAGTDVVINVPAGTFFLTIARTDVEGGGNGDLLMHGKIRLQGAGALLTKIDANRLDRAIFVDTGSDVVLSGSCAICCGVFTVFLRESGDREHGTGEDEGLPARNGC